MEVVPLGERLLVETRVRPSDIAFIRVGDRALVKVTADDFAHLWRAPKDASSRSPQQHL